jgi:hypothetical protein
MLLMAQSFVVANSVKFDEEENPTNIELEGRERPVVLPYNVYVEEYAKLRDGLWVFLLNRYRNEERKSADYFSVLVLENRGNNLGWKVDFKLFQPEMAESYGGSFGVIELGPMKSTKDAILKVSRFGVNGDPEAGDIFWEKWDIEKERQIEVMRTTVPFKKFESE